MILSEGYATIEVLANTTQYCSEGVSTVSTAPVQAPTPLPDVSLPVSGEAIMMGTASAAAPLKTGGCLQLHLVNSIWASVIADLRMTLALGPCGPVTVRLEAMHVCSLLWRWTRI